MNLIRKMRPQTHHELYLSKQELAHEIFSSNNDNTFYGYHSLLYIPIKYIQQREYPLICMLHGVDRRGTNINRVRNIGLLKHIQSSSSMEHHTINMEHSNDEQQIITDMLSDYVIVVPQCPPVGCWNCKQLVVDTILYIVNNSTINIDRSRIIITGYSMGGYGSFESCMEYSHCIAAIVPICGGMKNTSDKARQQLAKRIVRNNVGVWAFHGDQDDEVNVSESIYLIDAVNREASNSDYQNCNLTVYNGKDHHVWNDAYNTLDLYKWMENQKQYNIESTIQPETSTTDIWNKRWKILQGITTALNIIISILLSWEIIASIQPTWIQFILRYGLSQFASGIISLVALYLLNKNIVQLLQIIALSVDTVILWIYFSAIKSLFMYPAKQVFIMLLIGLVVARKLIYWLKTSV
jgi:poly(3-hydroxybutyrate) depolymerase